MTLFNEVKERNLKQLEVFVPVVDRVHGAHHPEFHEVKSLFESISGKSGAVGADRPELGEEFARLRVITDNYSVPSDVCESYEAVYRMLAELDAAYQG